MGKRKPEEKGEVFSKQRTNRCIEIFTQIQQQWVRAGALDYTVRATGPIAGLPVSKLFGEYFAVGVGNTLTEVPFIDVLVVMSLLKMYSNARRRQGSPSEFTQNGTIKTSFTKKETLTCLSHMRIETPFDSDKIYCLPEQESGG